MTESSCCQEDDDACGPFVAQEREIEQLREALEVARTALLAAQIFVAGHPDYRSNAVYVENMKVLGKINAVLEEK